MRHRRRRRPRNGAARRNLVGARVLLRASEVTERSAGNAVEYLVNWSCIHSEHARGSGCQHLWMMFIAWRLVPGRWWVSGLWAGDRVADGGTPAAQALVLNKRPLWPAETRPKEPLTCAFPTAGSLRRLAFCGVGSAGESVRMASKRYSRRSRACFNSRQDQIR